jgi:acid stress-induced BolA-like protein IbaG/YrbA
MITSMYILIEILICSSIMSLAAAWLQQPALHGYVLQAFCVATAGYLLLKKFSRGHWFYTDPQVKRLPFTQTLSLAILGFAVLLLVGFFGGLHSPAASALFVYLFFLAFSASTATASLLSLICLAFTVYLTPQLSLSDYGYLLGLLIYIVVVALAKKYYDQTLIKQQNLQIEREKIAYYNLYAEQQKEQILVAQKKLREIGAAGDCHSFLAGLIPIIDELQKKSRFAQNQMVVSQELTKIGLNLRQAVKSTASKIAPTPPASDTTTPTPLSSDSE